MRVSNKAFTGIKECLRAGLYQRAKHDLKNNISTLRRKDQTTYTLLIIYFRTKMQDIKNRITSLISNKQVITEE